MKRLLGATLLVLTATASHAEPVTYNVQLDHTSVVFEAKHFGTSTIRARIPAKSGTVTIDPDAKTGRVEIILDINAIVSGIAAFDTTLKSAKIFDTATYPEASFTATRVFFDGDKVTGVSGDLTMLGKSNPVVLKATNYNCYTSPMNRKQWCGGDFETTITRSQWNVNYSIPFVPDDIHLLVQIEAVRS